MRVSSVLIIAGVLLLGAFIIFYDQADRTTDGRLEGSHRLFQGLEAATRLELKKGGVTTFLAKEAGRWVLTEPEGAPVRAGAVQQILGRLDSFRATSKLSEEALQQKGVDLDDLGLKEPKRSISFGQPGEMQCLAVGEASAFGNAVYARLLDAEGVYTVDADLLDVLPDSAAELRDRSLGIPAWERLTKVELQRPGGFVRAQREADGTWTLTEPDSVRLETARLRELMEGLSAASIGSFVTDTPGDLGQYGLLEDAARLRWWTGTATEAAPEPGRGGELVLGGAVSASGEEGEVYATLNRFPTVLTVSKGVRVKVETPVEVLRERRLVPFSPDEVTGVVITRGKQRVELLRGRALPSGEEAWSVRLKDPVPANQALVNGFVRSWCTSPALGFPGPEVLGTNDTPVVVLTFRAATAATNSASWQVEVMPPRERGGALLRLVEEDLLVEAPKTLGGSGGAGINTEPNYYRDLWITRLDPKQVARVSRRLGEDSLVLVNDLDSRQWELEDSDGILNENQFDQFLRTACAIRAEKILEVAPERLKDFGLAEPWGEVVLQMRSGEVLRETILIGKAFDDGSRSAMVRGQNLVFVLPAKLSDQLTKAVAVQFK